MLSNCNKYYLAIDIGASSGRHIVSYKTNGEIISQEVYRFNNGVNMVDGHLIWDIDNILEEVIKGIKIAFENYPLTSLSIDSWGVDYVLLNGNKTIYPVYSYRDNRGKEVVDEVHKVISFDDLYNHTGCQFQPFNTIYQFYWDKKNKRLDKASDYLMIPEYLIYRLTGQKVHEFTNATTTGLISGETLQFDQDIIAALNFPKKLFGTLSQPKTIVSSLSKEIVKRVKGQCKVVLCCSHDTASAVESIPMSSSQLYLSSGTWSLLGVKTKRAITSLKAKNANYSNEGGLGYNRFQKNIMGMWIINELKRELCDNLSFDEIIKLAQESDFNKTIDVNDTSLLAPESMKKSFDNLLQEKDLSIGDYFKCAYHSLALSYKLAIEQLEDITGCNYNQLYIVGGGAKNKYLNQLTSEYTKKDVVALPIEASSLGNTLVQMEVK